MAKKKNLRAEIKKLRKALDPFVTFAGHAVTEHGWSPNIGNDRVCDWFGPTDFRNAREAYAKGQLKRA